MTQLVTKRLKNWPLCPLTADEARVLDDLLLLLLLGPEVGKRVDDDTEDQVENDDDDDKEEQHVVHDPGWRKEKSDKTMQQQC